MVLVVDEPLDFSHRDYRPDHKPDPTPKGIPLEFFGMNGKKAGSLLMKAATKRRPPNAKTGGHAPRTAAAVMSRAANRK